MAEPADSWEDMEPAPQSNQPPPKPAHKFTFNPNAPAFSFNPSAPVFSPTTPSFGSSGPTSFAAQGAAAPVAPPAPAPAATLVAPPAPSSPSPGTDAGDAAASALAELDLGTSDQSASDVGVAPVSGDALVPESGSDNPHAENQHTTADASSSEEAEGTAADPAIDADRGEHSLEEHAQKQYPQTPQELDPRPHMNVVFIGHVDAGKSTIGGQILYLSGMVDERTIQKYEREAKEKNRESWYMAYIMDTNEEERAKGKTVEVGRAHFETAKSRFTILDAPGHKNYVPNMITGASQADVGVLVISARKGEFETGFERGGQTREHAQLAKTLGVSKLLVAVNKMDDLSVEWAKERFDEIEKKMLPFLKACGYNAKKDVQFLPISGLLGVNMKERMGKTPCNWWDGPSLFEALDNVELPLRDPNGPFRMPLIDKFKDMGTVVMGKIESGSVRRGDSLIVMPNKAQVKVVTVYRDNDEVNYAKPGENLRIRLSGVEEEDISSGFVLSSLGKTIPVVLEFDAQLQILELLDHKAIFTAGYKAVLHIHSVVEECEIIELLQEIDPKTKKPKKKKVLFVKSGAVVVVRIQVNEPICVEKFEDFPQLGRFTLRDEGKTVAIGKVVKLPKIAHE
ncbi:peptide chain release factor subunit 3 [Marchantia polymorpha subsp. ruderalis]|uniref:Tr-type G domain-containing protein n=2 Tax=Marchantia polymorpha TaxID=3197 RepID=A0AAF6AK27_MARPO|nr:hypothetical protein MARPO_0103s0007 [Marchantia polymorpha]BBM96797.1 hypothetical protein Mp_1g00820 [Marchantia polymorpha subsp. ruderalis]|eukprot:PTQ32031.1 hypothetical protein MARPO_0103s0007 [Marchantia polymorpha]